MGSGGSKVSCINLPIGRNKSVNHNEGTKHLKKQGSAAGVTESQGASRLSEKTLRRISTSSIKPGQKRSLQNSSYSQLRAVPDNLFDPDDLISVHDLYNMLNDGAMKPFIYDPYNLLIVDSRDLKYFSPGHVITAKHHASVLGNNNFTMSLSNYSMIILYGHEIKDDADSKELANVRNDIAEYVAGDILVLKEGFDNFKNTYPFLCTDQEIESVNDRKLLIAYPSVILENQLYQGRGDQATNEKIVSLLKITHIVNISTEHKNAFSGKIKYFKLTLEDTSSSDLFSHLHEASDFINNAISKGGRVLVHCNLGVSRSSTVTLSYLIRFKKWTLENAFSVLKARRSCACPNAGFFKQLSNWEVEIHGERLTDIDRL